MSGFPLTVPVFPSLPSPAASCLVLGGGGPERSAVHSRACLYLPKYREGEG